MNFISAVFCYTAEITPDISEILMFIHSLYSQTNKVPTDILIGVLSHNKPYFSYLLPLIHRLT